jgi:hypothetical protein
VRIFHPGNKRSIRQTVRAPHRQFFVPGGVDRLLDKIATNIEKMFPGHEYRMVQIGQHAFTFVWVKETATA